MPNSKYGAERAQFETNRARVLATQTICGICGKPVDKSLKFPDRMCATVDHIIPVDRGGAKSDIDNLQIAHFCCNRQKSNKLMLEDKRGGLEKDTGLVSNRLLPQTFDWRNV